VAIVAPAIVAALSMVPSGGSAQTQLPGIVVVAPTPLAGNSTKKGGGAPAASAEGPSAPTSVDPTLIDRDKVPSNAEIMTSTGFDHVYSPTFLDALNRGLPGVSLSDRTGNPFQRDLNYRGFTASPVQGTPIGIAVYQNGVRINEAFGDVVNWDFIPEKAIDRATLFPSNPVFGLNAIGGALSLQMKNGFTYQGTEVELFGGSFGRIQGSVETGVQKGNYSAYAVLESAYDRGWRHFASSSHVNRMYMDIGARTDRSEFHINFTGADNILGNVAATPVEMLKQSWSSVYTWPQTTHLQLAFLNATLNHRFSDTWSFQGNLYYRGFRQSHTDGNGTDAQPCEADASLLCLGEDDSLIDGKNVPNNLGDGFLGEIDRNRVSTDSFGGTAQLTSTSKLAAHVNQFVMGASVDRGLGRFSATSELGTIDPATLFVKGTGVFIDNFDAGLSPADLHALNTYLGIYATDTFDVTNRLSITVGGRFNLAQIGLRDQTGENGLLNSDSQFQRFNPVVGATYKLAPGLTVYGGYSEANRAPTPLELGCSDPNHPCMIDSFLVADPPLEQVVSHTVEAGLRGGSGNDAKSGRLTWGFGLFRALSDDDIIEVASPLGVQNFGFFQNAGKTLRQGLEAKLDYSRGPWSIYANYTFVDATYQSAETLFSPNNPNALTTSEGVEFVNVKPGDHIPGIPAHRFKVGAEYAMTNAWKVGADLYAVGSQYLIHDDTNESPKVPGYAVLNLHTSYRLTPNVELFGIVNNVFNHQYYLQGTFLEAGGFTSASGGPNLLESLQGPTFVPGMPLAAYAGIKAKF
jgi:iron complex outermembrane receptor protein